MKKWMVFLVMAALMSTHSLAIMTPMDIAGTSFENEATGDTYFDTNTNGLVDHDLVNNSGQSHVDSTATSTTAGDLGFDATYLNTRNDSQGMSDGVNVGVKAYGTADPFTAYPDGSQGYVMGNSDGKMVLTFDSVDLSGYTNKQFSMQLFVNYTSGSSIWEKTDYLTITLLLTGADSIPLLDSTGYDLDTIQFDGQYLSGSWQILARPIDDAATSATLIVTIDSDAATETVYLDDIRFTGQGPVPEPASLTIIALGALAVLRRKKAC